MKSNFDVVIDCAEPKVLAGFWSEALHYKVMYSLDDLAVLVPESEVRPPVILQRVPETKVAKNRVHIDVVHHDVEAEATRLEQLGAHRLHDGIRSFADSQWITLADPEGNEFCVCTGVEW